MDGSNYLAIVDSIDNIGFGDIRSGCGEHWRQRQKGGKHRDSGGAQELHDERKGSEGRGCGPS